MHDVIVVGLPLLAILAGIFFNNSRFDRLESRMEKIQSDLTGRIDRMQSDLGNFYGILGEHKAKIENLEKQP